MRDEDQNLIDHESAMQEREAILFMLSEIESLIPETGPQRVTFDNLKEHFDLTTNLTPKQRKVLQNLYAKVTEIEFNNEHH
jgi:hypothetical protein